jgi:hypothetical protein
MEPQNCEACKVNNIICGYFKKLVGGGIEILRITGHQTYFYEIKIEPVKNKKCEYCGTCPDHET